MSEFPQTTTGNTDPTSTEKDKKKGIAARLALAAASMLAALHIGGDHAPAPKDPEISATSTPDAGAPESPAIEALSDQPTEVTLGDTTPESVQNHPDSLATPETAVTSFTPDTATSVPVINPEASASTFTIPVIPAEEGTPAPQASPDFNQSPATGSVIDAPALNASSLAEGGNSDGSAIPEAPQDADKPPVTPESTDPNR